VVVLLLVASREQDDGVIRQKTSHANRKDKASRRRESILTPVDIGPGFCVCCLASLLPKWPERPSTIPS
jgi:hypothetical protein